MNKASCWPVWPLYPKFIYTKILAGSNWTIVVPIAMTMRGWLCSRKKATKLLFKCDFIFTRAYVTLFAMPAEVCCLTKQWSLFDQLLRDSVLLQNYFLFIHTLSIIFDHHYLNFTYSAPIVTLPFFLTYDYSVSHSIC